MGAFGVYEGCVRVVPGVCYVRDVFGGMGGHTMLRALRPSIRAIRTGNEEATNAYMIMVISWAKMSVVVIMYPSKFTGVKMTIQVIEPQVRTLE